MRIIRVFAVAVALLLISLHAGVVCAATPTLIQHVSGSNTLNLPNPSVSKIDLWLKHVSLAGNLIIVTTTFSDTSGTSTATVTDDQSNTYTTGPTVRNATAQQRTKMFYVMNSTTGVSKITVTYGSPGNYCSVKVSEFNNVALSAANDGNAGGTDTTSPYLAPSITTTTAGDLIYVVAWQGGGFDTTPPASITSYTKGTAGSGFTLLDADQEDDSMSEYQIQASAGAIVADFTQSPGTATHMIVVQAFKSAAAGSAAPAGLRVSRLNHNNLYLDNTTTTYTLQFPCSGNLIVGSWVGIQSGTGAAVGISSITDSNTNTYTKGPSINNTNAGQAEIWWAANATCSSDLVVTLHLAAAQQQSDLILYDVTGAAVSPWDSVAGNQTATGNQAVTGNLTTVSITPSTSNGVVFAVVGINGHTISGSVGAGYLFDAMVYPEADGSRAFDEDNGKAHFFNTNTSAVQFVYSTQHNPAGVNTWAASAVAFKAAAAGGACTPTLGLLGVGRCGP